MKVVWAMNAPASVGEVHEALPEKARGAYNTVKTTLERLDQKGILSRYKDGKAYRYAAAVTQEELERRIVAGALDRLVQEFPDAVASFFVQPAAGLSESKLALLREAVERQQELEDA